MLSITDLEVSYGKSRILHGVSLTVDGQPLAVVGRNGMGKTTLCHAISGLVPIGSGTLRLNEVDLGRRRAHEIARAGIALVPQGRRLFASLTVEEHLRLAARPVPGGWDRERVLETFPRLAERLRHHGGALSGGEQQMLAIARALLANPRVVIMDEPTEGLAPKMVEHVVALLQQLTAESRIELLLVEQNLSVALSVAPTVAVMVNGRIEAILPAAELAGDRELQQRYLGVQQATA
ncbi:MAG: ABC transporter ATP-binding protein [Burkholderiaceae bacterium]|jgi:branched-chain amino acid transport system ATP-binding protein|nr:ABC transporter ATP-binding protein [Burkholderiaceae bacterium]